MRASVGIVASGMVPATVASLAFDAKTDSLANTGANVSFTHTPVGTPTAVFVIIDANTLTNVATACTYGGVAMTQVLGPFGEALASEPDQSAYWFFLGASVPTGAQTVAITNSAVSGGGLNAVAVSLTGGTSPIVVEDTTRVATAASVSNSSVALTITQECFCIGMLFCGFDLMANVAPGSTMTQVSEFNVSTMTTNISYRTVNASADTILDWVHTAEDAACSAVAVRSS